MDGAYYIGNRRKVRKLPAPKKKLLIILVLILSPILLFQAILLPQVRALCGTAVSNRLEALANKKAYEMLTEGDYSYSDFILLSYDANGNLRSASVDTVKLNLLKTSLALAVLSELAEKEVSVSVPLGNMLGLLFFSGRGRELSVTARTAEGMHARFQTVFTTAGINQTRHAIGFSLDFTAYYLLPTGEERIDFSIDVPLGETLIVGEVPETLTQINRMTDEISELEIDDAVDFGHVIP